MAKKIEELLINVKYKGIKPATTQLEALSEVINDAAIYADDLNNSLNNIKVPKSLRSFGAHFDTLASSITTIEDNTRTTSETISSVLEQLGINADAARSDMDHLVEVTKDLNSNSVAAGRAVEGLGTEIRSVAKENTRAAGSGKKLNNALKDVNRQGTNSVRNFSAMASKAGGIASIYALVAANVFAVSEAFRIMNEAASVERLTEIADVMSGEVGESVNALAYSLQRATGNTIAFQDALRAATATSAYGFNTEEVEQLALVARRASVALGVGMTDALNRVTRGISKQEIELLDELGITVRLTEAFTKYGEQHGLAADSLNQFQRQAALTNAVLDQSAQRFSKLDDNLDGTAWEKFGANISQATNSLIRSLASDESALTGIVTRINSLFDELTLPSSILDQASSLATTFNEALSQESRQGQLTAFKNINTELDQLSTRLEEINAEKAKRKSDGLFGDLTYVDDLRKEAEAIAKAMAILSSAKRANQKDILGGVDDINAAISAYVNLSLVAKSAQSDITTFESSIKGTNSEFERLASLSENIKSSIDGVSKTDINASKASLLENLGFTSIAELDAFLSRTDSYVSIMREISSESLNIARLDSQTGTLSVDRNIQALELQLRNQEKLKEATSSYNLSTAKRYEIESNILGIQNKLVAAKEAQLNFEAEQTRLEVTRNDYMQTGVQVANEAYLLASKQLATAQKQGLTADYILTLRNKELDAQEGLRAAKEKELLVLQDERRLREEFLRRNIEGTSIAKGATDLARDKLAVEQDILRTLIAQGDAISEAALRAQRDKVTSASRGVVTAQESASQGLQDTGFASAKSTISGLDSNIGNITVALEDAGNAWKSFGQSAKSASDVAAASAQIAGSALSSISSVITAAASASTSAIDVQIAAIKAQGDVSEEDEAKIRELNKKKVKEQEKAAKAAILISTAQAVANMLATGGPYPLNFINAGLAAAAGALAYQQASNSATSQLLALEASSSSGSNTSSLSLGDTDSGTSVDVSQSATAGERSQSLGDRGIFGRQTGGNMKAGVGYLVGETGPEIIKPKVDASVINNSDSKKDGGRGNDKQPFILQVQALDAQSLLDRAPEILAVLEEGANQQGYTLVNK